MRLSFVDECVEMKKKERRKEKGRGRKRWIMGRYVFPKFAFEFFFKIVRCQKMIIIFISSSGSSFAHFYYDE